MSPHWPTFPDSNLPRPARAAGVPSPPPLKLSQASILGGQDLKSRFFEVLPRSSPALTCISHESEFVARDTAANPAVPFIDPKAVAPAPTPRSAEFRKGVAHPQLPSVS